PGAGPRGEYCGDCDCSADARAHGGDEPADAGVRRVRADGDAEPDATGAGAAGSAGADPAFGGGAGAGGSSGRKEAAVGTPSPHFLRKVFKTETLGVDFCAQSLHSKGFDSVQGWAPNQVFAVRFRAVFWGWVGAGWRG